MTGSSDNLRMYVDLLGEIIGYTLSGINTRFPVLLTLQNVEGNIEKFQRCRIELLNACTTACHANPQQEFINRKNCHPISRKFNMVDRSTKYNKHNAAISTNIENKLSGSNCAL